jgi:hypothetical protein
VRLYPTHNRLPIDGALVQSVHVAMHSCYVLIHLDIDFHSGHFLILLNIDQCYSQLEMTPNVGNLGANFESVWEQMAKPFDLVMTIRKCPPVLSCPKALKRTLDP